jgi:hypothetical protein
MFKKKQQREAGLRAIAFEKDMEFSPIDDFGSMHYFRNFELFKKGGGRKITNMLTFRDPLLQGQVRSFDYQYTVSTGKSSVTYLQTVFWADSKSLAIPPFKMKPEFFWHKIGSLLGIKEIDFEHNPIFSDKYFLQSKEDDLVRVFFTDDILSFFAERSDWHIEAVNYYFIMYREKKVIPVPQYAHFLDTCKEVYDLFRQASSIFDLPTMLSSKEDAQKDESFDEFV